MSKQVKDISADELTITFVSFRKDRSIIDKISREYRKHKKNEMYKSVMNIIIRANNEQFKEARNMCEAILELFQDEVEMQTTKAINEGRIAGRNEGIITGRIENLRIPSGREEILVELKKRYMSC